MAVQLPGDAVDGDGDDVLAPARALREGLSLLGSLEDTNSADGGASILFGPPQSVALIESGITAATKWWSTGLGAAVAAAWAAVGIWWPKQDHGVQIATLGAAAVVTAALVLAI